MLSVTNSLFLVAEKKEEGTTEEGTTVENPFQGVSPDISPLGNGFDSALGLILGVVWGIVLIYCAVNLLTSFMKFSGAKKQGHYEDMSEHTDVMKRRAAALIGVAAFGTIVGAVLKLAGML